MAGPKLQQTGRGCRKDRIIALLRLEKTSKIMKSNCLPSPPCLLNHVLKCHIHTVFEPLQGWGLPHCPGQPGPRPEHSFTQEIFPDLRSKPPLTQLEAMNPN